MNPTTTQQITIRFPASMLERVDAYVQQLQRTVDPAATRATAIRILMHGGLVVAGLDVPPKKRKTTKKKARK